MTFKFQRSVSKLFVLYLEEKISVELAGDYFEHHYARQVDWLKGAFMLARREAIEKAGAVPEDYFLFAEDIDLYWQIKKKGYQIWFSPKVSIKQKCNKNASNFLWNGVWKDRS